MPERAAIRRPADTLAELQAMLPPGLVQSPRQPIDPPEVMEIWFSPQQPSQLAGRCSGLLGVQVINLCPYFACGYRHAVTRVNDTWYGSSSRMNA